MADKAIAELIAAEQITATDMFVLEQNGTAKKLMGQTLLNWLTAAADGHGGINNIQKTATVGRVDYYTITLADTTTFVFTVSNGNGIESIERVQTIGLTNYYQFNLTDGSSYQFSVTNGAKGNKGDNAYVHIKWAGEDPANPPHSIGDFPDNWIGIYSGNAEEAPSDYSQYEWFEVKGEPGETGDPATITSQKVEYQTSDSGTIYPSGVWTESIPATPAGKYLWTRTTVTFNTGNPVVSYSVGRMGIDGQGAVSTVAGVSPDSNGNVPLNATNVGAMALTGGTFNGPVSMNGQTLSGLNPPTQSDHPATMGYVNSALDEVNSALDEVNSAFQEVNSALEKNISGVNRNLLINWDLRNPVNQECISGTITTQMYFLDMWYLKSGSVTITDEGLVLNGTIAQRLEKNIGQTTKATYLSNTGLHDAQYDDVNMVFSITAAGDTIVAAKLELGNKQTLVKEVNGTIELLDIPDHAETLEKCQYYWQKTYDMEIAPGTPTAEVSTAANGAVRPASNGRNQSPYAVRFPMRMRTTPAITLYAATTGAAGKVRHWGVADVAASIWYSGETGFGVSTETVVTDGNFIQFHYVANARLPML